VFIGAANVSLDVDHCGKGGGRQDSPAAKGETVSAAISEYIPSLRELVWNRFTSKPFALC
jgi:hypothetical protein